MLIPPRILKILEQERAQLVRNQAGNDIDDEAYLDKLQADLMAPELAREAVREAKRQAAEARHAAVAKRRAAATAFLEHAATLRGTIAPRPDDTVGARVALVRTSADITQSELARACGVTSALVSQWENGHRPIPEHHLARIALLFDKPVSYFKGEEEAFDPNPLELPRGYALNAEGVICKHMMKALPNGGAQKEYVPLTDEEKTELRRQGVADWAKNLL